MFLSDGAVEIDKNVSEREMKRVILNRKNSLFVGNARGGRTAAILASLTSAAVAMIWTRNSISPSCWLTVRQRESRICWTGYQTAGKPRRKYAGHSINRVPKARSTSSYVTLTAHLAGPPASRRHLWPCGTKGPIRLPQIPIWRGTRLQDKGIQRTSSFQEGSAVSGACVNASFRVVRSCSLCGSSCNAWYSSLRPSAHLPKRKSATP